MRLSDIPLFHNVLFIDLLWVLLTKQEGPFANAALSPDHSLDSFTKDWKFDFVLNEVGAFRNFDELGIFEPLTQLADETSFDFILSQGPFVVCIFSDGVRLRDHSSLKVTVFVNEKVWGLRLQGLSTGTLLLLDFLVSLHLAHGLHEGDAVSQNISCLACLCDIFEFFIELLEMLGQIAIFSFFRKVHEKIENPLLTSGIEGLIKVLLDISCDLMTLAKVAAVPIRVCLPSLDLFFTDIPVLEQFVEKLN